MLRSLSLLALFAIGCSSSTEPAAPLADAAGDSSSVVDSAVGEDTATPIDSAASEAAFFDSASVDSASFDAASGDSASGDVADSDPLGSSCNMVEQKGEPVIETAWTDPLPVFTGGTIVDGTWVLTETAKTEGMTPGTLATRETVVISGASWKIAANAGSLAVHATGTATTSGNEVTFTQVCPAGSTKVSKYTASATQLIVRDETNHQLAFFTKL